MHVTCWIMCEARSLPDAKIATWNMWQKSTALNALYFNCRSIEPWGEGGERVLKKANFIVCSLAMDHNSFQKVILFTVNFLFTAKEINSTIGLSEGV